MVDILLASVFFRLNEPYTCINNIRSYEEVEFRGTKGALNL